MLRAFVRYLDIQRLTHPPGTDGSTHLARDRVECPSQRGQRVCLQWIILHVGIPRNHVEDCLANSTLVLKATVNCAPDPREVGRVTKAVLNAFFEETPD